MKQPVIALRALAGVALMGLAATAGVHFGAAGVKQRGIFLGESSPVRKEVFEALAARVFVVADDVAAARALGKSPEALNRSLPSRNWSYEPREDGFIVRWKLSYDDDMRYESWSDTVLGTNDFDGASKRKR